MDKGDRSQEQDHPKGFPVKRGLIDANAPAGKPAGEVTRAPAGRGEDSKNDGKQVVLSARVAPMYDALILAKKVVL